MVARYLIGKAAKRLVRRKVSKKALTFAQKNALKKAQRASALARKVGAKKVTRVALRKNTKLAKQLTKPKSVKIRKVKKAEFRSIAKQIQKNPKSVKSIKSLKQMKSKAVKPKYMPKKTAPKYEIDWTSSILYSAAGTYALNTDTARNAINETSKKIKQAQRDAKRAFQRLTRKRN